jgi:Cu-Zn family superoxide dismutase
MKIGIACAAFLALVACKGGEGKVKEGTVLYRATLVSADKKISGSIDFTQAPGDPLVIKANVKGLSKGGHAVHIHMKGNCSSGFKNVGAHFMGGMKMTKGMKPMGDLGNIEANDEGVSTTKLSSGKLTLFDGPTSIAGRAILVHAGPDPGSAGAKVACGVIKPVR